MRTSVVKELFELGVAIESKPLQVGDFLISKDVCVERKTTDDFLQSLIDKRLFDQAGNMASNFSKPIILLEGTDSVYEKRMIHPNAIRGALLSLATEFRLPVIQTTGEKETAIFLHNLAKREQLDLKKSVSLRGEKKPVTDKFLQEYIVTSLPGVGSTIAKKMLENFKTVENVFTASEKDLKEIEKMGDIKAHKIKEILKKKYKQN